ncbi:pesticin C-terminus-like muramidase [Desulfovibrio sp. OttesenSCG-928-A18]|nr:pesticin C-terminus-like muramidase [Desulfovibrio sp. OttesenSCG-928-A18]
MPIEDAYIRSVLERFENGGRPGLTKGYIPRKNGKILGHSGVTIGTGVDLGQQSRDGLLAMGVPDSIVSKFTPYLGKQKEAAAAALAAHPLVLSPADVAILDAAVAAGYISATKRRFNSRTSRRFADRPKEIQAVAVSLEYHLGPARAALYVDPLADGDYAEAARRLRRARDYASRRLGEAELVERAMQ